jgi:hypothetical protein
MLTPGTSAPEASFTVPKMVAVEVCATLRQVPNAINAKIAVPAVPSTRKLVLVLLAMIRSFRMQSLTIENQIWQASRP